jgi:hypothetical protein
VVQVAQEGDARGKRKAVDTVPSEDSDEEEMSLSEKARMLGYGSPKNIPGTSSATRVSPAMDHYPAYLEYLTRPRITDGVVENVGEPLQNELTYEEFLRDLLHSRSDKRYMWKQQLERIPGANLDPVIESPIDQSMDTGDFSSQEAGISSDSGNNKVVHSSAVLITEIPSSPANISPSGVRPLVPAIPTPDQPQPVRGNSRIQAEGKAHTHIMEKAIHNVQQRDLEGNNSINSNSFSALQDDEILSKALEIGIDVSSLPLNTINQLRDLEIARDNLAKKQSMKNNIDKIVEEVPVVVEELEHKGLDLEGDFDDFTPVVSRRGKKNLRKNSEGKKANQGVPLSGTKSLSRAGNNHPLCDIITGPRLRSQSLRNKK